MHEDAIERVKAAFVAYADYGTDDEQSALTDLLTDLRLYADEVKLDYFAASDTAYQHYLVEKREGCAMTKWIEVTADRYDEMLGVLPPEIMTGLGFLVGEPSSHRRCKTDGLMRPDFQAFARIDGRYYGADQCMTVPEFKRLTAQDVLVQS